MKKIIFFLVAIAIVSTSSAQKKGEIHKNLYLNNDFSIDGKLNEWSDSLQNTNSQSKLSYVVANNDTALYVAVKTSDPNTIRKILIHGFTFMINKSAKKTPGPAVIFPYVDRTDFGANQPKPTGTPVKMNQHVLSQVRGVVTRDFKGIIDGKVSLQNEYGIKAASSIDDKNVFRYELSIPLAHLELNKDFAEALSYQFRINGIERTVMQRGIGSRLNSYGYGPYGSYPDDTYARKITDAVEFWARYTLAISP